MIHFRFEYSGFRSFRLYYELSAMNHELSTMNYEPSTKLKVIHFQRKPRPRFNFSIESIFEDLRSRLKDKADVAVKTSSYFNNGYLSKLWNIAEAALRQKKNAVNHITGEVNFLGLLMRKKNTLLTIHDCRYVERKKGFEKIMIQWLYLKAPVKQAGYITAVSEHTKKEIIRYTACDPGKIQVIPVPLNPFFKPSPKTFNKECPVILQIGVGENKNIFRLVKALKNMNCSLVIIGEPNNKILEQLMQNNIKHTIKFNLSTAELYNEYVNADIISFVSTYEGFGMPIAEANCVERVVITSNISSMPEVARDAACLVDPYDVEDIKNGLLKIIHDDTYREQLILNGKTNKLRFNGQLIADAYYKLYKKIAQQCRYEYN